MGYPRVGQPSCVNRASNLRWWQFGPLYPSKQRARWHRIFDIFIGSQYACFVLIWRTHGDGETATGFRPCAPQKQKGATVLGLQLRSSRYKKQLTRDQGHGQGQVQALELEPGRRSRHCQQQLELQAKLTDARLTAFSRTRDPFSGGRGG